MKWLKFNLCLSWPWPVASDPIISSALVSLYLFIYPIYIQKVSEEATYQTNCMMGWLKESETAEGWEDSSNKAMMAALSFLAAKAKMEISQVTEYSFSPRRNISSVQFSHSVVSDYLRPHESQHARPPCPSPTPRVYPNPCPSSWWCHPAISSSVVPFSCPQSFPALGSFPMSQLFAWGGQSIGVSY